MSLLIRVAKMARRRLVQLDSIKTILKKMPLSSVRFEKATLFLIHEQVGAFPEDFSISFQCSSSLLGRWEQG